MFYGCIWSCLFNGEVEYESIKVVKNVVFILIIVNGDIIFVEKVKFVFDYMGVDVVMIGRGVYGCFWIFKEVNDFLENGYYVILLMEEKCCFMLWYI